jgi:GAF domain-containing protein
MTREAEVTHALVSLSSGAERGDDVPSMLAELAADCVRLLDVASSVLLMVDESSVMQVVAASSSRSRYLGAFELECREGPSLDCFASGTPTSVPDIDLDESRWPRFATGAKLTGFARVHALPMRFNGRVLGVLGLYGATKGPLNPEDLSLGQALADIASVALVHERSFVHHTEYVARLQTAKDSRAIIDQAKSVLMQHGADNWLASFAALRGYARHHNLRIIVLAQAIISGAVAAEEVVSHAMPRAG